MKKDSTKNGVTALKTGLWYVICDFILRAASFLTTPIFTRIMSKGDIGSFSNYNSWLSVLTIILSLNIPGSLFIARFDYKKNINEYMASGLLFSSIITILAYLTILPIKTFVLKWLGMDDLMLNIMFLYLLLHPSLQMLQIKWRNEYKYVASVITSISSVMCSIILSLILVTAVDNKLHGRVLGSSIPSLLICAVAYVYVIRYLKKPAKFWNYILTISIPLMLHNIGGQILSASDRIMITHFAGNESNALYSISSGCAFALSLLWSSMNNAWSPWAYDQMDSKNYTALKKASYPYTLFFILLTFGVMLMGPDILMIMGGSQYMEAIYVIPPICAGFVFQFVYALYVNIEFYHKKQGQVALCTAIAAAVNILLNLVAIPWLGYTGAAYTTLIGYALLYLMHFLAVRKMGKAVWYNTYFFVFALSLSVALMLISNVIYKNNIVRWSVAGVIILGGIGLILYLRKELIKAIKTKSLQPIMDNAFIQKITMKGRLTEKKEN